MTTQIFLSYAPVDEALMQALAKQLGLLRRCGAIETWSGRNVGPGEDWDHLNRTRLDSSRLILLLISADYLDSEHCRDQLTRAIERHRAGTAAVVPVLLRPCPWEQEPLLSGLRILPQGQRPVTSWPDQDSVLTAVTHAISVEVERLCGRPMALAAPTSPPEPTGVNPFEYGASVPPERFVGRKSQLADIQGRLGGISAQSISVVGLRRAGKSSLLRYVRERVGDLCAPEQRPLVVSLDLQSQRYHHPSGILEGLRRGIEQRAGKSPWRAEENDDPFAVSDGLEALRDSGVRLLVLLDEFESLSRRLKEFHAWGEDWRSKASAGCFALVVATTRPLREVYERCGLTSPFGNIFSTTTLGALTLHERRDLVRTGFARSNRAVTEEDLGFIDDLSGGLPVYTQMASALLWQHRAYAAARSAFLEQAADRFAELWDELTATEQQAVRHAAGARGLPAPERGVLDRLTRNGILREDGRVFSSAFADFVRGQR